MSPTQEQRAEAALAAAEGWPGVREAETIRCLDLPGSALAVRRRAAERDELEPALLVHGLGGSSRNWSALMERLAGTVECEALDLPGFGASPPPDDGDYSVAGHTRAVLRYLAASDRGPVHLLGNSLGGAVATRVAALRPDLIRTLTLISPALPERRPQRAVLPTALLAAPGVAGLVRRMTRESSLEQRARGILQLCYGDPARIAPEELRAAIEELERRQSLPYFWDSLSRSARGIVNSYTLGGQYSLWRQAERVLAPTLLVYGGRDRVVSYRMADRAAAAFGRSRLLALPDAGHMAMMEYPEAVADAFRELLADTGAEPAPSPRLPGQGTRPAAEAPGS
ncbi:alpha/beta hydrolase [Streptomyces sp. ACA25]|uniref:alpha/beta fold hydrolase n=1 Tax=Streptomyces sp. ACA25 TaxID=3022596 RepID=UPI002307E63F|nr:alpha/beta hydrolase [Streptomyces sp. ACA25]MDB1086860.1 alpha/beta hydrolase [Streptomyces sp. ACA25]